MNKPEQNHSSDRAGRTLIKAFTFAGAILGVGMLGFVKTLILLGAELDWWSTGPKLWSAGWWILGGAALGLAGGWTLVRTRRRL